MSEESEEGWPLWARAIGTVALLVALVLVVQGAHFSDEEAVSGDIALNATSGPAVTFTGMSSDRAELTTAFPDANTVRYESTQGNISVSAQSQTSLDIDSINGTWTNASSMGMSDVTVTINPDDKQAFKVNNTQTLDFRSVTVDDGTADFSLTMTAEANVTITGLNANAVAAKNSTGSLEQTSVSNGEATLQIGTEGSGDDIRLVSTDESTPALTNPDPDDRLDQPPNSVSVDLSDDDFPNDEVDVSFTVNGNSEGTDSLTSDGTASTTISDPGSGTIEVSATATDDFGNTNTLNWTFKLPNNLTVRDAQNPDKILDNRTVNATFFEGDSIVEKSTDNGNISMDNISGRENVVVSLDAENNTVETPNEYYPVENVIIDYSEQTDVYMLPKTATTRTVRFTLDDRSGGLFTDNGERVLVQKPLNQSGWSNPRYETIFADEFGPEGATAELEDGQRYRIVVQNDDGDERILGAYSADADETVPLEVGSLNAVPESEGLEYAWNATHFDDNNGNTVVQFELNDTTENTENLWIEIYEYNNESNVLATNQSFGGPHGNFSYSEIVPADQENLTWTVEVTLDRGDSQNVKIKEPVGPQNPLLNSLPTRLKTIISIGTILIVGGLFSQLNGAWGGLVMAGLGGIFWWIGFLPEDTGIGVVVLAMVVAAAIYIRERQVSGI